MNAIIENKVKELREAILNSEEYQKHQQYIEVLKKDKELYRKVNDLRKKVFILQNGNNQYEQKQKLDGAATEFEMLRRDERVGDFLQHELDLCRLLQEVNSLMYEPIDLGIEFF